MFFKSLAVALAVATASAAAQAQATPTTLVTATTEASKSWTTISVVPYPYSNGQISLISDSPGGEPTASLSLYRPNQCGGGTEFASATTINLPVNCLGAKQITTSIRYGHCPLGLNLPPNIVDTVTATPRTAWGFTCAPTPSANGPDGGGAAAAPSYQLADVTHTLPVPTLRAGQTPPEIPTSLQIVHHPDGTCRISLGLTQADARFANTRDRVDYECSQAILHPTQWAATVTQVLRIDCDGCQWVRGGGMTTTCARSLTNIARATETVTVAATSTRWIYDCEPRV